jgi:sulfur-oxidizing protein SoxY
MTQRRWRAFTSAVLSAAFLLAGMAVASAEAQAAGQDDAVWQDLREAIFADQPILPGDGVIGLEAPYRAMDAAIVPITMVAQIPQGQERYIRKITLIIDKNPAPVGAVFHLSPNSGSATISTRIRVDAYTNVRAVAETNDGQLYMATKFVKAAGGCSSPGVKDQDEAIARMGKMKLKQSAEVKMSVPNQVQLLISHPNHSGFQRDVLTLYYIPAHFVQDITVAYGAETILSVEGGISLSEDPSIHFSYVPTGPGELSVQVRDTEDQVFTGSWPVSPELGS